MITGKSLAPALSFWHTASNHTPNHTPRPSPASSDYDTEEEEDMDGWNRSRPLSLAIPQTSSHGPRPSLADVLNNLAPPPYTLTAFMAFLSQNHCLETLEFTMDSKRYRESYYAVSRQLGEAPVVTDCPQTQHLRMLFQRILTAYIVPAAPREINVSSEVRDGLLSYSRSRVPPVPDTLDAAIKRMHDLMEESIFIPFLNSHSNSPPHPVSDFIDGMDDMQSDRHALRRRLSPQTSFVSPRPPAAGYVHQHSVTSNALAIGVLSSKPASRTSGYTSGDTGSATLTDDSGSLPSSPGGGEPMTPPTTPPSSDIGLSAGVSGHSPKSRPDNAWKKMSLKLGWKKRMGGGSGHGSRDPRFPATEEE
ncbi:hypothetical protein AJ80_00768 [Polytolypa hystricis UAMH7299]|uniref:RGS domain-containing protein n=1 Tax=Polytolypa hystricis (strain UAMH7299) TaxID=1447883 RepID=A0A2B7Z3X3_POLH7|nr:hypothetical protein AJ80_00768 [Polytolypa hystricis UAMH7299]